MTFISIVVPVYKVEKYLEKCVQTLTNQTYDSIEIILVDDGSPDSCPEICDRLSNNDKRIKVIHKQNGGLSDARNVGLSVATGKYIMFVDSDDYISLNACESIYNIINNFGDADVIVGDAIEVTDGTNKLIQQSCYMNEGTMSGKEYLITSLKNDNFIINAWIYVYNRRFLHDNNLLFKKDILHEDLEFTPRALLKVNKLLYLKVPFYFYIRREGSISKNNNLEKNAIHIINTCYELESIYKSLPDDEIKILLLDNLAMTYLSGIQYGKLYKRKYSSIINKKFAIKYAIKPFSRKKARLFYFNKYAYYLINVLYSKIRRQFIDGGMEKYDCDK